MRCVPPVGVYVPVNDDAERELGIDRGSAIVGVRAVGTSVLIYFEGNRHGAANMQRFADKALHAAGRWQQNYPTVARRVVGADLLSAVGTFDGERVDLTDRSALERWVGHPLDVLQLAVGP